MTKKICFFMGNSGLSGGTERVSIMIANELAKLGYSVSILSLYNNGERHYDINKNIECHSMFSEKLSFKYHYLQVVLKLRRYVKKNNIQIIFNVESMLCLYSIPAVIYSNVKNVCWEHFNYNVNLGSKLRTVARNLSVKFCDRIITLTETDAKIWRKFTTFKARITTIPNPSPFPAVAKNHNNTRKEIISVGRLTYQKGFDLLLEAWSKISFKYPGWKLVIIGSGEERDNLLNQQHILGLQESVNLVSHTKNIQSFYEGAAFYAMSSRYEGFPMVLLEAISYGIPIISFDCDTGPSEIITNNSGWLAMSENISDLSQKIECAIEIFNMPEKYEAYSQNAYNNAGNYALDKIIVLWRSLIDEL